MTTALAEDVEELVEDVEDLVEDTVDTGGQVVVVTEAGAVVTGPVDDATYVTPTPTTTKFL